LVNFTNQIFDLFLVTLVIEHFELITQKQFARSKTKYIYIIIPGKGLPS